MQIVLLISTFLTPIVILAILVRYSHLLGLVDTPNERSMHTNAIPRSGGVAIFLSVSLTYAFFNWDLVLTHFFLHAAILLIFIVGLIDDRFDVSPRLKFVAIFFATIMLYQEHIFISSLGHYLGYDAVIHFAGLKAVGESVTKPLEYYDNNVNGTLCLLRAMQTNGIKTLVFSSSATVYGDPEKLPLSEDHPLRTTNPYGQTKLVIEEILRDLYRSDESWRIMILRYFNPVGAHESGLIGEDPQGIPNNLMPFVAQVAIGRRENLTVFGGDYPTHDGTGVRDYIHVVDLANGHLKALESLITPQCSAINLGTGTGYSVLDVVRAFADASGREIPYIIAPRREGDIATCYADPSTAAQKIGWSAKRNLDKMCKDAWNFQSKNPKGYV